MQAGFKDRRKHYLIPLMAEEVLRRGQEASDKITDLSTSAVAPPYMLNEDTVTRQHPGYTPQYLGRYLQDHGLWVRTSVRFDPPLGSDLEHPGDPQDPLLVIRTLPIEEEGAYFPYKRTTNKWQTWHVSLCFKSEHWAYTNDDLRYLVDKFHNQKKHLRFSGISTYITSGNLDTDTDPIASDPVVQRIHGAGHYRRKPIHISF